MASSSGGRNQEAEAAGTGIRVRVHRLEHGKDLPLPRAASVASAGCDLRAALTGPLTLGPGDRALVPAGIAVEIPSGWEGQVRPRSGLAIRHGVSVLNAPGTIDADYRGEIGVVLVNHGSESFVVEPGMRIAQIVFAPVARVTWEEIRELSGSARGDGGFGSTGTD